MMRPREFTIMRLSGYAAFLLAFMIVSGATAAANPRSEALRREGYDAAYNLDYDRAKDLFAQAIAADPNDATAYRGAASLCWLRVLFLRGTVLVEDYLGHLKSASDVPMPAPPADLDTAFRLNIDKALALAEKAVNKRYNDASSHSDLGAALGISASYAGLVEGRVFGAMRLARRAFSESGMALELDSHETQAGLVAGTYRYLVSTLPAAVRVMAYIVGFGGGREEGLRLIEKAAATPSEVQADARVALVLIYNREKRYDDAVNMLHGLERSYPQNRLFLLEEASTLLRGNKPAEANKVLEDAMGRLAEDRRPRMPGEDGRWHLKRGAARLRLGKLNEAEQDLRAATTAPDVRGWVQARIHIELGKLADVRGDRAAAQREYRAAIAVSKTAHDDEAESLASQFLAKAYKQ
jgi:tetratricopeptide (TPR) repeat protein